MKKLWLGIFLGGCAWTDGRKREVSLLWLCLWALVGTFYLAASLWSLDIVGAEEITVKQLSGIFTGIFLLVASLVSKGQIGMGDGLVFLICGLFLDFWQSSLLLMGGLLLLIVRHIGGSVWGNRKENKEYPLFPYIFAAYIGGLFWNL